MPLLSPRNVKLGLAMVAGFGAVLLARRTSRGPFTSPPSIPEPGPSPVDPGLGPVDPYAPHEPADSCAPPQEGAKLFRRWALATWGERPGSPENLGRACTPDKFDEHEEGRAWDLMTNSIAHGQSIVDALLAPDEQGTPDALARRAGIMYLIWNKQMWRAYPWQGNPSGTWGAYTGPNPHTDHIHFSFSKAGGAGETSLYPLIRQQFPNA